MLSNGVQAPSVLLISASHALKRMLQVFLTRYPDTHFSIREAESYVAARDLYAQHPFDLVLLTDTANGGSAIAWLHAIHQKIDDWHPILFIHNGCDPEAPFEALRHGAQDALPSGQLDSTLLHMAMHRILQYQNLRRKNLRMEQELARSNHELTQFARSIGHDLREPLRKIRSFGALLQESCADRLQDEEPFFLERMLDAANRMDLHIGALLEYALAGHKESDAPWTALADVLNLVREDLELALQESSATLSVQGTLPLVRAHSHRLQQLLQNLLSNAIKYRNPERPLQIRIDAQQKADHTLLLQISDNGKGFPSAEAEKLFQLFHRQEAIEHSIPGHGIGLALCRRIAESLGGSLTACGEPDRGASFSLTLPDVKWDAVIVM